MPHPKRLHLLPFAAALCLPVAGVSLAAAHYRAEVRGVGAGQAPEFNSGQQCTNAVLVPSVSNLDFGTLPKGGRQRASFWLYNSGPNAVEISRITASCDCLHVTAAKNQIAPGERIPASAEVDFSDDPGYAGRLLLEASAEAVGKRGPAFAISINVTVE